MSLRTVDSSFPPPTADIAHAIYYPPANAAPCMRQRRASTAHRDQPWRADDGDECDARSEDSVLDESRCRRRRRELSRQLGFRPRLSQRAARPLGCRRRCGHGARSPVPRRGRTCRRIAADHSRRQRRRLHDAGGADVSSRRLQGRRELLRDQRHRGARARHAQVRGAIPRSPRRSISRRRATTYRARSPIHFVDRLACPLILFQGLEDRVVPPNQSEMMAGAARAKGLPVAYLTFEGEQHGFRKADTIVRSLEAELYFYGVGVRFHTGRRAAVDSDRQSIAAVGRVPRAARATRADLPCRLKSSRATSRRSMSTRS